MLYTEKLLAELERTRERFTSYQERYGQQLDAYRSGAGQPGRALPLGEAALCRSRQSACRACRDPSRLALDRPVSTIAGGLPAEKECRSSPLGIRSHTMRRPATGRNVFAARRLSR